LYVREHVDMIFKLVAHKFDWQVRYIYNCMIAC
jgi:hypothetical protein